jgi:hypothetical protein
MTDTWLTPAEDLTARKRWAAQCRALAQMGVAFRANAVGRPLVERAAVLSEPVTRKRKKPEPYWGPIRGKAA